MHHHTVEVGAQKSMGSAHVLDFNYVPYITIVMGILKKRKELLNFNNQINKKRKSVTILNFHSKMQSMPES